MRTFRSEVANAITYVTNRRSSDLTYAVASHGTDIDPEVEVYVRRVNSFKRAIVTSDADRQLINDILEIYRDREEPGISGTEIDNEELSNKEIAEEPGSSQRGKMRKQCDPKGPVGFLLETLHLNGSVLDVNKTIRQYNQPPLNIEHGPHQQLVPIVRQYAMRNRTIRACGTREETDGLMEIDREATTANKKKLSEEDRLILEIQQPEQHGTVQQHTGQGNATIKIASCAEKKKNMITSSFVKP